MKKIGLLVLSFTAITGVTSCGLFSRHVWSWEKSTVNDTINYCLLIGQEDHNDSNDRTAGIRSALDTKPTDPSKIKPLANLEEPKIGEITLRGGAIDEESEPAPAKKFTVKELEHREQKSLAGTTWDPITANGSAATWTAKHGEKITMFVSNNDGMAEGALGASCWYQGMPIFGYDANKSTLRFIQSGRVIATIDSNTPTQCLSAAMLIRNICDHTAQYPNDDSKFNPCSIGFRTFDSTRTEEEYRTPYGFVNSNVSFDGCSDDDIGKDGNHAILVDSCAVTNFPDVGEYFNDGEQIPVKDYFDEDGKDKSTETRAKDMEPNVQHAEGKRLKVLQSYYSNTDVYFSGNMDPFFKHFYNMFNIDISRIDGDATNEDKLVNNVIAAINGQRSAGGFDAIMLNVIKQPNCDLYVNKIAQTLGLKQEDDWSKRSNIPLIFWNRQPTNLSGEVSKDVMNNKFFKYTYYIGFGAKAGGDLQGKTITSWLNYKYVENYHKN